MLNRRARITFILLAAVLSACGHMEKQDADVPVPVWPAPPEAARIKYIQEFSTPQQLGIEKSGWLRFVEFFSGTVEQKIIRPMDIAVDSKGVIYVTDPGVGGVHMFDRQNKSYKVLRQKDGIPLPSPIALSLGKDGIVYVSDSQLGRLFQYRSGEDYLEPLELDVHIYQPTGLAFDLELQRLYIADTTVHRIICVSPTGSFIQEYGSRGADKLQFNYPTYLAVDERHRLYVTDSLNFRIQILDRKGVYLGGFGQAGDATGNLARPKGVATDSDGHIYVVDSLHNGLQIFNRKGQLLMPVGQRGTDSGEFWLPTGIFIDRNDNIYVADTHNQRVQILHYLRKQSS